MGAQRGRRLENGIGREDKVQKDLFFLHIAYSGAGKGDKGTAKAATGGGAMLRLKSRARLHRRMGTDTR